MLAIVACNQAGPEVKPDAFEEANQAIPSSNVDMTNAQDITEDQTTAFTADFNKAKENVGSGFIAHVLTADPVDLKECIEFYLNGGTSKVLYADSDADAAPFTVEIDSLSGMLTLESDKLVLDGETEGTTNEISDLFVTATLSGKVVSLTVTRGKLKEGASEEKSLDNISIKIDLTNGISTPDISGDSDDVATFMRVIALCSNGLADSKETIVNAEGLNVTVLVSITGTDISIPVAVSVDGSLLLSSTDLEIKETSGEVIKHITLKVDSLKVVVDAGVIGSVSASIKGLSFGINTGFEGTTGSLESSLSVDEVSLSGELLPLMDDIKLRSKVKDLKISTGGIVSVGSVEATVLGYKNISIAANITGFKTTTSDFLADATFDFGAAVSFEDQTIGIRGEWGKDLNLTDVSTFITIAVLNGTPVTPDSLIDLVMGNINGTV